MTLKIAKDGLDGNLSDFIDWHLSFNCNAGDIAKLKKENEILKGAMSRLIFILLNKRSILDVQDLETILSIPSGHAIYREANDI